MHHHDHHDQYLSDQHLQREDNYLLQHIFYRRQDLIFYYLEMGMGHKDHQCHPHLDHVDLDCSEQDSYHMHRQRHLF